MVALNRNHLMPGPVLALAGLRGELIRRLRERLSVWSDLHGSWLFGSVARGENPLVEGLDSDLAAAISGLQALAGEVNVPA